MAHETPPSTGEPLDPGEGDDGAPALEDLDDMLVAIAAAARISLGLAEARERRRAGQFVSGKAGLKRDRSRRGRPVGTLSSPPFPGARPDPVATLRAAAPWQGLRRAGGQLQPGIPSSPSIWQDGEPVRVLPGDFRFTRHRQRTASIAIFADDASGSTAHDRLGEAKGAIELLLAECYVRRDQVALVAFRGHEARILLEPTRSLARAKRSLIALPGGGPTPLADGMRKSLEIASTALRHGQYPLVVLLTDGNANVALDGTADRSRAREDAERIARSYAASGIRSVVIDVARRPRADAALLAKAMHGDYRTLPHANAHSVSRVVGEYMQAQHA